MCDYKLILAFDILRDVHASQNAACLSVLIQPSLPGLDQIRHSHPALKRWAIGKRPFRDVGFKTLDSISQVLIDFLMEHCEMPAGWPSSRSTPMLGPGGTTIIAQRFTAGFRSEISIVPEGRLKILPLSHAHMLTPPSRPPAPLASPRPHPISSES